MSRPLQRGGLGRHGETGLSDGLKGLSQAIGSVWQQAVVQTCVVHMG
ncbi:transposase [Actinomadura sp. ATCC 31491]|uniref:Transposase n=2 Tax=Actinomadura luzonensis TaxID=2805427 RepID=A0ABT0G7U5_9ACTN|nr:transposase [Actinomadura luzonensis]MCK2220473.1 transposase [Actinomadura luzonensis]